MTTSCPPLKSVGFRRLLKPATGDLGVLLRHEANLDAPIGPATGFEIAVLIAVVLALRSGDYLGLRLADP